MQSIRFLLKTFLWDIEKPQMCLLPLICSITGPRVTVHVAQTCELSSERVFFFPNEDREMQKPILFFLLGLLV